MTLALLILILLPLASVIGLKFGMVIAARRWADRCKMAENESAFWQDMFWDERTESVREKARMN